MIYFLQRSDGAIKIGTATDFNSRLAMLTRQHGKLELLGAMDGRRDLEQQLHKQFAEYRIGRTEFFREHDELRAYIAKSSWPKPRNFSAKGANTQLSEVGSTALGILKDRYGASCKAEALEMLLAKYASDVLARAQQVVEMKDDAE